MASSTASSKAHGTQSEDVQSAIAKAVELRSLHAALLQRSNLGSPAVLGPAVGASPSALRRSNPPPAAEDYPVFTPSYEEDSLQAYDYIASENQSLSETWRGIKLERSDEGINLRRNAHPTPHSEQSICFRNEHFSRRRSSINHVLLPSPAADILNSSSSLISPGYENFTTCNSCRPAAINKECEGEHKNFKVANVHNSELQTPVQTKQRGPILSWLFPSSKKKPKPDIKPHSLESEDVAQILKDLGLLSLESLKKNLIETKKNRDAALAQVSEMRSSLGELQLKLINLETYCDELKKALRQANHAKCSQLLDRPNLVLSTKSNVEMEDYSMPVSNVVLVEGFLQMVSETRLSVKQFCKMLIYQIEESDQDLMEQLSLLLQPHQIAITSDHPKLLRYHVEALINRSLYQDFENCAFQRNGSPKFLDRQQDRHHYFQSFISLRNLSWNEVLHKGTKYYSEEFSRFCDQKMSSIVSLLNWARPWPEPLLQCFFVAAKCIWLLHLLAFSFSPPLVILRVAENQKFDPFYMEDVLLDRKRAQTPIGVVQIMIVPGMYIEDRNNRIMKCKVLCRY